MKRFITACAICAFLFTGSVAIGDHSGQHTWSGLGAGNNWSTAGNWVSAEPTLSGDDVTITSPGTAVSNHDSSAAASSFGSLILGGTMNFRSSNTNDIAFTGTSFTGDCKLSGSSDTGLGSATVGTGSLTLTLLGNGGRDAGTLKVDADGASAARALTLAQSGAGSGGLTTSGLVTLEAYRSGSGDASLTVNANSGSKYFFPNTMLFYGDPTNGHAVATFNEDTDVTASTSSTGVIGDVDITVATSKTFNAKALSIDASAAIIDLTGPGTMGATSLTIDADTPAEARDLTVKGAGIYDINGAVTLSSDTAADSLPAKLKVDSTATNFRPDSIDVSGTFTSAHTGSYVEMDFDADVVVQSSGSAFDGFCDIDIAANKKYTALATTVGSTSGVSDVQIGFDTSPGSGEFEATTLTISAGDGSGEYAILRNTSGTLDINGEFKLEEGSYTDDNSDYAKFIYEAAATDVQPNSMRMVGEAVLDLNESMGVDGEFRIELKGSLDTSGQPDIDLAENVELKFESFVIDATHGAVTLQPTFASGSQIVTGAVSF